MTQMLGTVILRTNTTLQIIPRIDLRQVEVLDNGTVKWWLAGDDNPFSWQFFDEEGDQALSIAEQFFNDLAIAPGGKTPADDVEWHRTESDDEDGEVWERNGKRVIVEASA